MARLFFASILGFGLAATAVSAEPLRLTPVQMDEVTASGASAIAAADALALGDESYAATQTQAAVGKKQNKHGNERFVALGAADAVALGELFASAEAVTLVELEDESGSTFLLIGGGADSTNYSQVAVRAIVRDGKIWDRGKGTAISIACCGELQDVYTYAEVGSDSELIKVKTKTKTITADTYTSELTKIRFKSRSAW